MQTRVFEGSGYGPKKLVQFFSEIPIELTALELLSRLAKDNESVEFTKISGEDKYSLLNVWLKPSPSCS